MIEALPEVLGHESKGAQQSPAKVVKAGVVKVGVGPNVRDADVGVLRLVVPAA